MTETRNIAWKRLAIEAAAIVVSILLAFAIAAWWEERGERQAEIVLLERLRTDFSETQAALADKVLAWPGLVDALQEEEANLQEGVAERWTPYLASRANLGPYVAVLGEQMQGMPGHVSMPTNRQPLIVDADFVNHVLDRFKWQQIALRDIEPVRVPLEDILRLLEIELES